MARAQWVLNKVNISSVLLDSSITHTRHVNCTSTWRLLQIVDNIFHLSFLLSSIYIVLINSWELVIRLIYTLFDF
ncbi:hypothetical protein V1478_017078 [Vespula squamosa]|uniref:Uncharacterized protein n=1 Tax=Vespula squamosa TaxID=30214 RepID=A0ABD2A0S5_VESSQ